MTIKYSATNHFQKRVAERMPGVSPFALAKAFAEAIQTNDRNLTYEGRSKATIQGTVCRKFSATTECGAKIVAVVSDDEPRRLTFVTAYVDDGR